ncbi:hypothetical protein BDP55DRAFT_660607 [Colletotrichum godetiae]|uniref:Uncharacterized protein n=1 Tax=Colletotrichum godetiae TaxID=1209918 RepID=A0AAJ0AMQ8_9PEZI|nr:uncharacterized protein BDP55DRAFT_660607 [Colletotrichum godetiae]KAK1676737.1 hypothetical protein BDP55DRAFT_660607 [Colletotrichum godetiae]
MQVTYGYHVHAVAVSTSILLAAPLLRSLHFTYQCHHPRPSLRATGPDLSGDLIDRLNATLSHEIFRVAEPRPARMAWPASIGLALHDSLPFFGSYLAFVENRPEYLGQHSRLKSESSGRSTRSHRTPTTNKDVIPMIRAFGSNEAFPFWSPPPVHEVRPLFPSWRALLSFVLHPHRINYCVPVFPHAH